MKFNVFHGSGNIFDEFMADKAKLVNDYYGGQLYFTDNPRVAKNYAKAGSKKTGQAVVYKVELDINKLFDVDQEYSGKEVKKILGTTPLETFARRAGLLSLGSDRFQVLSDLKNGNLPLTGEQIFNGISNNQRKTAVARSLLKKQGYDGLKYYGGRLFGSIPHVVYIPYEHSSIHITGNEKI